MCVWSRVQTETFQLDLILKFQSTAWPKKKKKTFEKTLKTEG